MRQIVLTVSQSKRLIARGLAAWPPVVERMREGMIVIAKGTTNRYVAEELLGESLNAYPFAWGLVRPPDTPRQGTDIPEIVIIDGERADKDFEEAIDALSPGDIFIKGGNALHYPTRTVGILSSSSVGGTIGRAYPKVVGTRVRLVVPIGLEKLVFTPIEDLCSVLNSLEPTDGRLPTMYPVRGHVFTEIEALQTMLGVEVSYLSAGGVYGCEGSVRLLVRGSPESLRTLGALEGELKGEPAYGVR